MRPILEDTSSRGMAMLIAALFLAVVATAALQFLWLRRLAASHNEVLTGSLQVNASQLAETVTRDLATLVGYFTEQSAGTDCRQQLAAWNARKDIPARVHGIYRVRALNDVHLRGELIAGDGIDQPRAQAIINRIGAAYREGHLPLAQGGTFVPLFDWETASVRVRERAGDDTAWLVLVLNRATFRDPYLTELVRRHFGSAFDVAITRARSGNVVYTAATSDIRKSADLTFDIYDPAISTAVHEASAGLGPQAFQQIRGNGQPAWKLFVRHRAGSIVRAVEQTRMRAAAIATVTLLLLLTSSAALAQSARRSRQFATQRAMFASMVTHELLTPLTVIRSAAETLSERLVSDPDRVSHYGTVIREEGRRLTQTIADVLDLSTGSVALNIERI
ncbi:MAG TPA: histidine kinase dimerization/phospho-acceptor domain-containing protein, partial [Thermoanaerobaculia bacterium]